MNRDTKTPGIRGAISRSQRQQQAFTDSSLSVEKVRILHALIFRSCRERLKQAASREVAFVFVFAAQTAAQIVPTAIAHLSSEEKNGNSTTNCYAIPNLQKTLLVQLSHKMALKSTFSPNYLLCYLGKQVQKFPKYRHQRHAEKEVLFIT